MSMGRPLAFNDVATLESAIDTYFKKCKEDKELPTVTMLAYHLGVDRRTLVNYEDREDFFPTIKKAKTFIEAQLEIAALMGKTNPAFSIFNLKNNFGWKDKTETEVTGGTDPITVLLDRFGVTNEVQNDRKGNEPISIPSESDS